MEHEALQQALLEGKASSLDGVKKNAKYTFRSGVDGVIVTVFSHDRREAHITAARLLDEDKPYVHLISIDEAITRLKS